MPYFTLDEDGNPKQVPIRYTRSEDYKTYYAHGAQGGILGSYHFRVDFYREDIPPNENVTEKGGKVEHDSGEIMIKREIDLSVYMSLPFAKQLRDWLDREIGKFEDKHGQILIAADEKPEALE
jgi:hypothetical protein